MQREIAICPNLLSLAFFCRNYPDTNSFTHAHIQTNCKQRHCKAKHKLIWFSCKSFRITQCKMQFICSSLEILSVVYISTWQRINVISFMQTVGEQITGHIIWYFSIMFFSSTARLVQITWLCHTLFISCRYFTSTARREIGRVHLLVWLPGF